MENKDSRNLLLTIIVGFLLYSLLKGRFSPLGSYTNEEVWDMIRDDEGNLIKIVAHRNATEK